MGKDCFGLLPLFLDIWTVEKKNFFSKTNIFFFLAYFSSHVSFISKTKTPRIQKFLPILAGEKRSEGLRVLVLCCLSQKKTSEILLFTVIWRIC